MLADDQRVVREGLGTLLGLLDGIELVATAADGEEAVALAHEHDPDVVLMDLRMPRVDGIEAIRRLAALGDRPRAIALTTYADDASVLGALRAGARGYLTKDAGADEIRAAVEAVARGEAALDPSVQHHVVAALAGGGATPAPRAPRRADPARGRGARPDRRGPDQRGDRRAARGQRARRSRPTSTTSSPRPACATARRPSSTRTRTGATSPLARSSVSAWSLFPSEPGGPSPAAPAASLRNWIWSYCTTCTRLPNGSRKSRRGPRAASRQPSSASTRRARLLVVDDEPEMPVFAGAGREQRDELIPEVDERAAVRALDAAGWRTAGHRTRSRAQRGRPPAHVVDAHRGVRRFPFVSMAATVRAARSRFSRRNWA